MRAILLAALLLVAACVPTTPPADLIAARQVYRRAESGPAPMLQSAAMRDAKIALDDAEAALRDEGNKSARTLDLAYVALRRAERAEALGELAVQRKRKAEAEAAIAKLKNPSP